MPTDPVQAWDAIGAPLCEPFLKRFGGILTQNTDFTRNGSETAPERLGETAKGCPRDTNGTCTNIVEIFSVALHHAHHLLGHAK